MKLLQHQLNEALATTKTEKGQEYDEYLLRKGELLSKNDFLIKQLKALEEIEVIKKELVGLKTKKNILREDIISKEK